MYVRHEGLSSHVRKQRQRLAERASDVWSLLAAGEDVRAGALLRELEPRVCLHVARHDSGGPCVELEPLEPRAWPSAELFASCADERFAGTLSVGRSACALERALAEVEQSFGASLARATLRAGFVRGHLLDVTLHVPELQTGEKPQLAAEMLVRRVLGDRLFETWIGEVRALPAPRGGPLRVLDANMPSRLSLSELYDTVAAGVRAVLSQFEHTSVQRLADGRHWTLLELEPLEEARGLNKDDLFLISTCTPELVRCYLEGTPCSSRRFTQSGAVFAYVAYADAGAIAERMERRAELERAIVQALSDQACVTGLGFGTRGTYVDLALLDVEWALARLVPALRARSVPNPCQIVFFDSQLADDCVSIWSHHSHKC